MAQPVTAASGWRWFLEGVRALRMQPLALTGIVVFYILISGLLSSMPFIGTMAAAVWMPFGAVLVGFAARDTLAGRTPVYGTFIAAFRKPGMRLRLIGVGLISAACMEVIMLIFQLLSKASIAQWDISEKGISLSSVADNLPVTGLVVSVALYVPLLMATLFAPLLIADAGQGIGKSFFYSFFGILRNFAACFTAGALIMGITALSGFAVNALFFSLGIGSAVAYAAPLFVIVLSTISQAMVWPMYRDLFGVKNRFDTLG